ncbi:MAG: ABC transporter permease, partial [Acidimicrobiia bacterium]|nr:ABC transporter permease [Acidimicrobiia bacterium]
MGTSAGSLGARMWARSDLRRRWRSLVVLGLLAGLSASLAIAAVAGSRRADTAFGRLRARTDGADAVIFPSQSRPGIYDWSKMRALPYVKTVAPWSLVFGTSPGSPPGQTLFMMPARHGGWLESLERPVVIKGRMFRPAAVGEVVVDEDAARGYHISVGDTVPFQAYDQQHVSVGLPKGAKLELKVVGVIREPSQFLFTGGLVFLSPGTGDKYGAQLGRIDNAHVKVRNPATDMDKLRRDAGRLLAPGTPVLDLHSVERRVSTAISVERLAQLLLGIAAAIAAIVFVGQALSRSASTIDDDALVLRGLGLTRGNRTLAAVLPHVLVPAVAVPVAFIGTLVLSPRFPIGFARSVDPDVGVHIDWVVVLPGVLALVVLLLGGATVVAWRRSGRLDSEGASTPSSVGVALRRAAPVSIGLGTTMAFEPGRGRRTVPVRPALLGAIAGVLGIVGTFTIAHGLDEALANPQRAGVTWDMTVAAGSADYSHEVDTLSPQFVAALKAQRDASDISILGRSIVDANGAGVPLFDSKPVRGDVALVTVKGRAPASDSEVAIGPATAKQLDVGIGDTVKVSETGTRKLTIVGEALFPNEVHSGFTEGLWATPGAFRAIAPATDFEKQEGPEQVAAIRWRDGVNVHAAQAHLQQTMGKTDRDIEPADVPPELTNLKRVRSVPAILVAFLVLLAVSSLAHVLVTSVRRRRGEF